MKSGTKDESVPNTSRVGRVDMTPELGSSNIKLLFMCRVRPYGSIVPNRERETQEFSVHFLIRLGGPKVSVQEPFNEPVLPGTRSELPVHVWNCSALPLYKKVLLLPRFSLVFSLVDHQVAPSQSRLLYRSSDRTIPESSPPL